MTTATHADGRGKSYPQAALLAGSSVLLHPWNKGASVTRSCGFKPSLAFLFGHLSKPQVHPRAAKTPVKPNDKVSEGGDLLLLPDLPATWLLAAKTPFSSGGFPSG